MVPKPDGSVRFCIDYRKLNLMTVKDPYPIPRMDECIDSLGDARVFSTLDFNAGYWQIPVAEEENTLRRSRVIQARGNVRASLLGCSMPLPPFKGLWI